MKRNGFTLIELMIVIVVAGILLGIAIPSFNIMFRRRALSRGKAIIIDYLLRAKSHAASGAQDWEVIFDGPTNTVSLAPVGLAPIDTENLPNGCSFTNPGLNLTFEFYRDGTAGTVPVGNLSFSIENDRSESILFTLIPQIGEVNTNP